MDSVGRMFSCLDCALQGLVLGPFLSVLYLNDLDVNVGFLISTFVDDMRTGAVVGSLEGYLSL